MVWPPQHICSNTAWSLEIPSTSIQWAVRSADPQRSYGGEDRDGLPEWGALGTQLEVSFQDGRSLRVDALAAATGFRPDLEMLRELRLELDPTVEAPVRLAPLIDPAVHSCGTVRAHGAGELAHPEE